LELTKNELEIMELLWKEGRPLTSADIVKLSVEKTWKDSSIHILINSLLKKGAIQEAGFIRTGKGYGRTFETSESGEQYYTDLLAAMARKASIPDLFSALFKSNDISEEIIEELESLLNKKKQELE